MTKKEDTMYETDTHTLGDLFSYWRASVRYRVKPSTYACYCTIIEKHILPDIGGMGAECFDNEQLKRFLKKKQEQFLSGNTQRLIIFLLKSMLRIGAEAGCRVGEPLHYYLPRGGTADTRLMSEENFRKLLQRLIQAGNNFELGLLLSVCTGMRVGELCGLQWGDIEAETGVLRVRRTVSRIQNTECMTDQGGLTAKTIVSIGPPKTGTSARDIPLPDFVLPVLEKRRGQKGEYVLTGSEKCMEPRGVQRRFKNFLRKQGIPEINIHSLRHSFASNWIENGFDTKALSEILGHSSVKITLDIYVHSSMHRKRSYMNQMHIL